MEKFYISTDSRSPSAALRKSNVQPQIQIKSPAFVLSDKLDVEIVLMDDAGVIQSASVSDSLILGIGEVRKDRGTRLLAYVPLTASVSSYTGFLDLGTIELRDRIGSGSYSDLTLEVQSSGSVYKKTLLQIDTRVNGDLLNDTEGFSINGIVDCVTVAQEAATSSLNSSLASANSADSSLTFADEARLSAEDAGNSAHSANDAKGLAQKYMMSAEGFANNAAVSETNASTYANDAYESATDARNAWSDISSSLGHVQLQGVTDAERKTATPLPGELVYTTDTNNLFIGDGTTLGGIVPMIGSASYASGSIAYVLGTGNFASSGGTLSGMAIGYNNSAAKSYTFGVSNKATGSAYAFGANNKASSSAFVFGSTNEVTGSSYAFGLTNKIRDNTSFAVGEGNIISGSDNYAFGSSNNVSGSTIGSSRMAIGFSNVITSGSVNSPNIFLLGYANKTITGSALGSLMGLGISNQVGGGNSHAVGSLNYAQGTNNIGVGYNNYVSGSNILAFGSNIINLVPRTMEVGYWSNQTTRKGSIRLHDTGDVAFTVTQSNTVKTDGGAVLGSEITGSLMRGGMCFRVDITGSLWADWNSGSVIRSARIGIFP